MLNGSKSGLSVKSKLRVGYGKPNSYFTFEHIQLFDVYKKKAKLEIAFLAKNVKRQNTTHHQSIELTHCELESQQRNNCLNKCYKKNSTKTE